MFAEDYRSLKSIEVGMAKAEVLKLLGSPTIEYTKSDPPKDYYVGGCNFEEHPISGAVLIYVWAESIGYYYLDDSAFVEHVFVGGA